MQARFETLYALAIWLVGRLHDDHDLLRALMGGDREVRTFDAMAVIEREAAEQGWTRGDINAALRAIECN